MPKVIDLFAGVGGLSLGASRAGFDVSAAVELDSFAISSHGKNFPGSVHLDLDVAALRGSELLRAANLKKGELDGLIGGPPCQGFSTIGRRDVEDLRNNLFDHFFRLVAELKPAFFVAENVPGILDEKYDDIRAAAFKRLPKKYVALPPIRIQANLFGAATIRTRVFFIGFDPSRFSSSLTEQDFLPTQNSPIVTVSQALVGLPIKIDPAWQTAEQGWRRVGSLSNDAYALQISGNIPTNVGHMASVERYVEKGQVSGCMGTRHTKEVVQRFKAVSAGKSDVISKAVKLDPLGFCPTLRAGTSKEKGSYQAVRPIHFSQPRVITAREAARLQGFPDWFVFHDTKWHSFRQIGNSVSPIVAEAVLRKIFERLK